MTRKDYEAIAAELAAERARLKLRHDELPIDWELGMLWRANLAGHAFACQAVARALAADNPRFDEDRFLIACGVRAA